MTPVWSHPNLLFDHLVDIVHEFFFRFFAGVPYFALLCFFTVMLWPSSLLIDFLLMATTATVAFTSGDG